MVAWAALAKAAGKATISVIATGTKTAKDSARKTLENKPQQLAETVGISVANDAWGALGVMALGGVLLAGQLGIAAFHLKGIAFNPLRWGELMSNTTSINAPSNIGQAVATQAKQWAGKHYRQGEFAQCAFFVHEVLNQMGIKIPPPSGLSWDGLRGGSEGLAAMFFHDDVGQRIPVGQQQPGDLVAFANTYGNFAPGAITHVGIWVGDGMMVDRPTASAPVKHRVPPWPIAYVVRPHAYATLAPVQQASLGGANQWDEAINLIKEFEGFSAVAYDDHAQASWGYGTKAPYVGATITEAEAKREFLNDLQGRIAVVESLAPNATQPQKDALLSWHYNTGQLGQHSQRNVYSILANGGSACDAIMSPDWMVVTASGQFMPGLERRRLAEQNHSGC